MIKVNNLKKNFNNLHVLEDISFEANEGQFISIIGPSGCGKSTLLRCITGLEKIYGGDIILHGLKSFEYFKKKRISVVLQKYSNFHWLSVYSNILTGFNHSSELPQDQNKIINSLLIDLQIVNFKNNFINELSGGMQQRVAIARALAQNTDIMALDEPFGALDIKNRHNLQMLFKQLNTKYKKTVLFITHDIEEAIFLSDKILILSKIPARIVKSYVCNFKNEMSPEIKFSSEFIYLRKEIRELMFEL
jgi:ABC-type nitrate/sulfonate/bicarbonate transport system ATPase subunit